MVLSPVQALLLAPNLPVKATRFELVVAGLILNSGQASATYNPSA